MAKNVQIVPLSGALEFENGSGGKYLLQITGTKYGQEKVIFDSVKRLNQ